MSLSNILTAKGIAYNITSLTISDATAAGRALLTASTVAAQLSALSVNLLTVSGGTLAVSGLLSATNINTSGNLSVSGTAAVTGVLTAPTAIQGTNTTQVATTAFVTTYINSITGLTASSPTALVGLSPVAGSSVNFMRADAAPALDQSISPTWTGTHSFATLNVTTATVSGILSVPTATAGTSTTQAASTAFVLGSAVRYDAAQTLTNTQKQRAQKNASAAPWSAYAYQNIAINPRFFVSQFASVANSYIVDGYVVGGTSAITMSAQRISNPFPLTRPDLLYGLQATITAATTSLAAGDFAYCFIPIEGNRFQPLSFGGASAQNMAFGITVKASVAGNYYISLRNGTGALSYVQKVVLAANTETFVTLIFPGCTSGTWTTDTTQGASIAIVLAGGTTYQGAANSWTSGNYLCGSDQTNMAATVNATFTISDLILLPVPTTVTDPTTMFPIDQLPLFQRQYLDELNICQRYYQNHPTFYISAYGQSSSQWSTDIATFVNMRISPIITLSSLSYLNASGVSSSSNTSLVRLVFSITAAGSAAISGGIVLDARF